MAKVRAPRPKSKNYLVVWGNSTHAVRSTTAVTPGDAALHAFGVRPTDQAVERMTFKEVPREVMHSSLKRTKATVELLQAHEPLVTDKDRLQQDINEIVNNWQSEWERYEQRYGRIDTGDQPFTVGRRGNDAVRI